MITIDEKEMENIVNEILEDIKMFMDYLPPIPTRRLGAYRVYENRIGSLRYFIDKAIRRRMK